MTNCCTQQYCYVETPFKLVDKKPKKKIAKKVKVYIFWEGHANLKQSSTFFLMLLTKKNGRLFQIFVAFSEYIYDLLQKGLSENYYPLQSKSAVICSKQRLWCY